MTGLKDIPEETRWRLAAEFSARVPAVYDAVFRPALAERYNELDQEVWMELSRSVTEIARHLSLPTGSPKELAETMRTVMIVLFGPGFKNEALELAEDRAVIVVKRCPFLGHIASAGQGEAVFHRCMAFTLTAVPLLNGKFSARFVRTICTGDRQCEIKIEANPPAPAATPAKKEN